MTTDKLPSRKPFVASPLEQAILDRLPARVSELCEQLGDAFPPKQTSLSLDRWIQRHVQRLRRLGLVEPRRAGRMSVWCRVASQQKGL